LLKRDIYLHYKLSITTGPFYLQNAGNCHEKKTPSSNVKTAATMATVGKVYENIPEATNNAEKKSDDIGGETNGAVNSENPIDDMEAVDMFAFFEKRKKEFPDLEDIEEIRVMIGEILKQEKDRGTAESYEHDNEEVSCMFYPMYS